MYYNKKIDEIEKELETNSQGLSKNEVKKRQEKYGKNQLPRKKADSIFKIFINEFNDPMIILLLFAIVASFITGELIDGLAILFIILVDAVLGTYQENKANHVTESLEKLVTTKTKVIRDGNIVSINTDELTIGDYVLLESGDKISADMRIVEAHNFMVDESILTGESVQVSKDSNVIEKENIIIAEQTNMVFSGTTVVTGRAKAIVVGIGLNTEIGKIADSINQAKEEKSPLTIRVEKLSKQISKLILVIAVIVAVLLIMKQVPYSEIFLLVVALSVSAMPEGLPLSLTIALTIASNKMSKQNVVVRKLNSAESLGSCTVIASDKTGTLTINEQTAKRIVLPNGDEYNVDKKITNEDAIEIAKLGYINNEAQVSKDKKIGDSIDIAFKILGNKLNVKTNNIKELETIPYESENKFSAIFYEEDNNVYCTVKGSLEVVRSFCKKTTKDLEDQNEKLAKDGYRVIALASGKIKKKDKYSIEDIKGLTFKGMVGFIDPIRKEAVASIQECKEAGIKVLMITGDHPLTSYSIAKELKLVTKFNEVTTGVEIDKEYEKDEESFDNFIKTKKVFSRVTPIQKLKIVESLKRQGEFVAVTGDGVNDAPALKAANIGIAMGSGTDIARETADMIILDDNFKSIVAGIKEGRVAYANIRKIIYFLISCGLSEVLFFSLSIFTGMPIPLVAIQLLWLNVVTDGLQDIALSFEKAEKGLLKQKPISPKETIFNKRLLKEIIVSGLIIGSLVFFVWYFLLNNMNMQEDVARGYIMALMVFIQNIHVFNCRSESSSVFDIPLFNNPMIIFSSIGSIVLHIIVMEVPFLSNFLQAGYVPIDHLIYLFLISFTVLIIMEIYKMLTNKQE
ncbi:MAG: HAD-IC family P-type ATPase [Bacilli bacterium]|nr:HAD-IC family P-type ATPase [Bacilli bacterium]